VQSTQSAQCKVFYLLESPGHVTPEVVGAFTLKILTRAIEAKQILSLLLFVSIYVSGVFCYDSQNGLKC